MKNDKKQTTPETCERDRLMVDKWIKELSDAGYTYDDMISIFRESQRKWDDYKKRMANLKPKK